MKKTILVFTTVAFIAFIGLIGTQAFACYWDGYWNGPEGGPAAGISSDQHQGFYANTAQLRQDLAAKRGERHAMMSAPNSNPERVAELNGEIASLHDQLKGHASSYNLPKQKMAYHGQDHRGGNGRCW